MTTDRPDTCPADGSLRIILKILAEIQQTLDRVEGELEDLVKQQHG